MNMRYLFSGQLFGTEFKACSDDEHYYLRFEATERGAALVYLLGGAARYIGPAEDSGRAWYQIEYSPALDDGLVELVEFSANVREHHPNFGQLELL